MCIFKKKELPPLIDQIKDRNSNYIMVYDDRNKLHKFIKIAVIKLDKIYVITQPKKRVKGMGKDEALVFRYTIDDVNPNGALNIVEEDDIVEKVFAEYNRLLDAQS